jgi:SAM-dependent methyltransferase
MNESFDGENIRDYNRGAWDLQVEKKNPWTLPVSSQLVDLARKGEWHILLTPSLPVPRSWFPEEMRGCKILCLASGGGQQGPLLTAAGAEVTVFDNSPRQLEKDREVSERDHLELRLVEGDMRDLSIFTDGMFDLILHPVSNVFIPDIRPVWREAHRVLRPGGFLLAGLTNPILYMFDDDLIQEGIFDLKYRLPYSDLTSRKDGGKQIVEEGNPLEFGHTLQDQIGGQIDAGFTINGFYEDRYPGDALSLYTATYIATRAYRE